MLRAKQNRCNVVFAISLSRWSKAINSKICENFSKIEKKLFEESHIKGHNVGRIKRGSDLAI